MPLSAINNKMTERIVGAVKKGNKVYATTAKITSLNLKIQETKEQIINYSYELIDNLILQVRQLIDCLYNLSHAISTLDLINALGVYSKNHSTCTPEF